jgi:quercetin dioxygenase-like cupin family protein
MAFSSRFLPMSHQGQIMSEFTSTARFITTPSSGNDTSGACALLEAIVPPGGGPPPHIHSREHEAFYVLEGELQFHADDRNFTATSGAWVTLARGSLHFFTGEIGSQRDSDEPRPRHRS